MFDILVLIINIVIQISGFLLCKMAPLHGLDYLKQRVVDIIQFAPRCMWKIPHLLPYIFIKVSTRSDAIN